MRFTAGEMKVMQLLWTHGEMKPAELLALFPEPIKNPSLRSYLSILLEKGHVVRRKVGKAYFYKAKTKPRQAWSRMLREMLDAFFDGSAQELVLTLVRQERLTTRDLDELRSVAEGTDVTESKQSVADSSRATGARRPGTRRKSRTRRTDPK